MKNILKIACVALLVSSCASNQAPEPPLTPDVIRTILIQNIKHFRECYTSHLNERELKNQNGYVKLVFTINPNGDVIESKVTDQDYYSKELNSCLRNEVLKLKFPRPLEGGTVEVKQPMNLYPKQ